MKSVKNRPHHPTPLSISSASFNIICLSSRTFLHCLKALWVNTQVLKSNVISLHTYMATQSPMQERSIVLSQLHIALSSQDIALRNHITRLQGDFILPQEWRLYADLWRIADLRATTDALTLLAHKTDLLSALYESMLPASAVQPDRAVSLFLFAEHLNELNAYFEILRKE